MDDLRASMCFYEIALRCGERIEKFRSGSGRVGKAGKAGDGELLQKTISEPMYGSYYGLLGEALTPKFEVAQLPFYVNLTCSSYLHGGALELVVNREARICVVQFEATRDVQFGDTFADCTPEVVLAKRR
jgi:hypothetical protein